MKVLDSNHDKSKLTCIESWISGRQVSMSKQEGRIANIGINCMSLKDKAVGFHRGLVQHQKLYECLEKHCPMDYKEEKENRGGKNARQNGG